MGDTTESQSCFQIGFHSFIVSFQYIPTSEITNGNMSSAKLTISTCKILITAEHECRKYLADQHLQENEEAARELSVFWHRLKTS